MLSFMEVLELMAAGESLPHERFGETPKAVTDTIRDAEPEVLNSFFRALEEGKDPMDAVRLRVDLLSDRHGWYPTCGTIAFAMAHRFGSDDVPDLPALKGDIGGLLRAFSFAATVEGEDDGAWTIPMAMLASLGQDEARNFAACSVFCAGYKVLMGMADR